MKENGSYIKFVTFGGEGTGSVSAVSAIDAATSILSDDSFPNFFLNASFSCSKVPITVSSELQRENNLISTALQVHND